MVPPGKVGAVLMVKPAAMVSVNALLAVMDALSVICTVKLTSPALVGVPLMAPDAESSLKPAGREPVVIDQLYGAAPPVAPKLSE